MPDARIAADSTRGIHIVAEEAGHWILIDEPGAVIDAVKRVVDMCRSCYKAQP